MLIRFNESGNVQNAKLWNCSQSQQNPLGLRSGLNSPGAKRGSKFMNGELKREHDRMTCIMWSWWRSHRDERTGTLRIARIQRTMNALSLDWKLYESTDGGARKIKHFQQDKITIFWYFNKIRTSVSQQALFRHNKHTETKKIAECIHAWRHSWGDKSSHRKPKAMLWNKRMKASKRGSHRDAKVRHRWSLWSWK